MVDVRIGSKYASSVNDQMAYFMKRTFRKSGPLEKADPETLQIVDPMPKFTVLVKKALSQIRGCRSQI